MQYTLVGLGNYGAEYNNTRHNAGYAFVEWFALKNRFEAWRENKKAKALYTKEEFLGEQLTCILPQTYMNRSGSAVLPYVKSKKAAERLIVVYDDIDLPLGKMKIAFGRGSGGHRGLESIMRALKTRDFVRVRIGVASTTPGGKLKKPLGEKEVLDFLMGKFKKSEQESIEKVYKQVHEAIEALLSEGRARAMNQFN